MSDMHFHLQNYLTAEMSRLLRIAWVTRLQEKNNVIRQALGSQTTLQDKVVQRRLGWFVHVERMTVDRIPHHAHFMQDSKEKETKADPDYDG